MCENVWVCINVWVCMICFFVWRWRDYIISISSCLSFLLDDEVYVSYYIGEKRLFFCDFSLSWLFLLLSLSHYHMQ